MWFFYCVAKNKRLKSTKGRFVYGFEEAIVEIQEGNFLVIVGPSIKHQGQRSFLIELGDYPFLVPFNRRGDYFQLITLFPDRRYK